MNIHDVSWYLEENDRCGSRTGTVSSFFHRNKHECDGNRFAANEHALPLDLETLSLRELPHPDELYLRKRTFRDLFVSEWIKNKKKIKEDHQLSRQVRNRWRDPGIENALGKVLVGKEGEFSFLKDKREKTWFCGEKECACSFRDGVKSIDLQSIGLHYMPPCLSSYTNLENLNLKNNEIEKIDGLDNLVKLKAVKIENNNIKMMNGFNKLVDLENLMLANNKIEKIEGLDNLVNLESLSLVGNHISKIEGLDNLSNLKVFYVWNNKIDPDECKEFRRSSSILYVECF